MPSANQFYQEINNTAGLLTIPRIKYISSIYDVKRYLEIGVCNGDTFLPVSAPCKVAVDPDFRFDYKSYQNASTFFYNITSDDFFAQISNSGQEYQGLIKAAGEPMQFDLIFIDGLHTFEQSFRDFENSLSFAHDKTVWLIDDTVPCDPYSSFNDFAASLEIRKMAGLSDSPWHGDVYKTVFAIHDKYPEYSYCTLMGDNPQTVVWKSGDTGRKPRFSGLDDIARLNYFDIFKYADLLMPFNDAELPKLIGKTLNTEDYRDKEQWKKLIYKKAQVSPKKYLHQRILQGMRPLSSLKIKFK